MIIYAEPNNVIHIGRAGEHLSTKVVFDISEWIKDFGKRQVNLIVEQNSLIYPQVVTVKDNEVIWDITSSNTAQPGLGKCELFYSGEAVLTQLNEKPSDWESNWKKYYNSNGVALGGTYAPDWPWEYNDKNVPYYAKLTPIIKSAIYQIIVTEALGAGEDKPPGAYESWVDEILESASTIQNANDNVEAATAAAEAAKNAAKQAREARDEAKKYIGNPPEPRPSTGTWWVYDPDNTTNPDGYLNTYEPYGLRIYYVFDSTDEMNSTTPSDYGICGAINIPATVTEGEKVDVYVYTTDGWERLFSLSGEFTGGGGTGDGNMKAEDYDPGGAVIKSTYQDLKGIPAYVKNNSTQITWKIWTLDNLG